jgi:prophage antirepressor-like protein
MSSLINSIDKTINFNEKTIRIVGTCDNPLFVAIDICKILGLKNVTDTLRSLPEKWKQICDLENSEVTSTARRIQGLNCINEAGLYKLIMRSNKPIAQKFQEHVCEVILPSIRKHGEYKLQSIIDSKNKEINNIEDEKNKLEDENKKSTNEIKKLNIMLHKRYEPKVITQEKFVVYLLVAYINGRTIYIIGKTADITKRYRTYKLKGILIQEQDIKLLYYKSCRTSTILNQVENNIILKMSKYIIEGNREVFESDEISETDMVDKFKEVIDFFVNSFEDVLPHITINNKEVKEEARIRTELYVEENREEVNEKVREDRKENPEKFQEREQNRDPEKKKSKNKRYYEKNREEILKKQSEYVNIPEIKEKIAIQQKNYREEHSKSRSEYLKKYRIENKDKIIDQKTQKIKCTVCKTVFGLESWKRHTRSTVHQNILKEFTDRKEEYEYYEDEDNKDEKVVKEDDKDKIVIQKVKCLVCKISFGLPSWKRHTRSTSHKNMLTEFPNIKEEYEHEIQASNEDENENEIQASKENDDEIQDDKK